VEIIFEITLNLEIVFAFNLIWLFGYLVSC